MIEQRKTRGIAAPLILLLLVFCLALSSVSCDTGGSDSGGGGGGGDPALQGTWTGDEGKLIINGNSIIMPIELDDLGLLLTKGTISISGANRFTITISQISLDDGATWKALNENNLLDAMAMFSMDLTEAQWNALPNPVKQEARETIVMMLQFFTEMSIKELINEMKTMTGTFTVNGNTLTLMYDDDYEVEVYYKDTSGTGGGGGGTGTGDGIIGKWNIYGEEIFEFQSNGSLKVAGYSGSTYTISGNILSVDFMGMSQGTFNFVISGTGSSATLTLSNGKGEFAGYNGTYTRGSGGGGGTWTVPSSATALTINQWKDGTISSSSGEAWYSFNATSGITYYVWLDDSDFTGTTKTMDAKFAAYYSNGDKIFDDDTNDEQFTANSSGTIYVRVYPYYSTGTFAVAYSSSNSRPGSSTWTAPSSHTAITLNQWKDGSISSSSGEAWYSFSATAANSYYIWLDDSDNSSKTLDAKIAAYYSNGNLIVNDDVNSKYFYAETSGTIYIRVYPYSSGDFGTFAVAYSTSSTKP